jgi:fatty acid desaturase
MAQINAHIKKPSKFLLFPWGLTSIILILVLSITLSKWFGDNWSWLAMVLIIPAAIFENLKIGYTEMRVMFLKILYSLLSFLIVGFAFGIALAGKYYESKQGLTVQRIHMPWYVLIAILVVLLIEVAHIFSLLKSVKREFMQVDE